jgi:putative hydrolase of the HAD superfamily
MRYRAVIFDLFGTLADFSFRWHEQVLSEMAAVLGVPYDAFARVWPETYRLQEHGMFATIEAVLEHICDEAHVQAEAPRIAMAGQMYLDFQRRTLTPRPDALHVLARLQASGHKVGLITNCPAVVETLWSETPFAALIDVAIFSCGVGIRKPSPEIYQLACRQLGEIPQECLYIGDGGSRELSGASKVGMDAALIRVLDEDPEDARRLGREEWGGSTISSLPEVLELVRRQP